MTTFICIFIPSYDLSSCIIILHFATLGQPCSFGRLVYRSVRDSIMPSKKSKVTLNLPANVERALQQVLFFTSDLILTKSIYKNAILSKYNDNCKELSYSDQVTTTKKGEPMHKTTTYTTIYQLVRDCSMKPDNNHYYQVQDLTLDVLKFVDGYLSDVCIKKLHCLNRLFHKTTTDVCRLRSLDFSKLKEPRIGYADKKKFSNHVLTWPLLESSITCCIQGC